MPEYKELNDAIHDVSLSMARMEGKLDTALELKHNVSVLNDKVEATDDIAREALATAKRNENDISAVKSNNRWALGLIFPSLVTIVIFILTYVVK